MGLKYTSARLSKASAQGGGTHERGHRADAIGGCKRCQQAKHFVRHKHWLERHSDFGALIVLAHTRSTQFVCDDDAGLPQSYLPTHRESHPQQPGSQEAEVAANLAPRRCGPRFAAKTNNKHCTTTTLTLRMSHHHRLLVIHSYTHTYIHTLSSFIISHDSDSQ